MKFPREILELHDALVRAGFDLSNQQAQESVKRLRESRHPISHAEFFILGWLDAKAGR